MPREHRPAAGPRHAQRVSAARCGDLTPGAGPGDDPAMLSIDLRGKRAQVCGVADDGGFGWAIAKALAEGGASVCLGTWPPALGIFQTMLARGKLDASMVLSSGAKLAFEKIYPLDA